MFIPLIATPSAGSCRVSNQRNFEMMNFGDPNIPKRRCALSVVLTTYYVRKEAMSFLWDTVAVAQPYGTIWVEVIIRNIVRGDVAEFIINCHLNTVSPIVVLISFPPSYIVTKLRKLRKVIA